MEIINRDELRETISALFEGCQKASGEKFPNALIPVYSGRPVGMFMNQLREAFDFALTLKALIEHIDDGNWPYETDKEMSVRLSVLTYCHIMEADLPYLILINLCRVAEGSEADWLFLARNKDVLARNKKGDVCQIQKTGKKIEHLKVYALAKETCIVDFLEKLWRNDIRNAFSHSHYCINSNGTFEFTNWKKDAASTETLKLDALSYDYHKIKILFKSASEYICIFGEVYGEYIAPYENSSQVILDIGPVCFDREKKKWRLKTC
jgi:hypothetical protein